MERIIHYNIGRKWKETDLRKTYIEYKLDHDFPFIDRSETIPHYLNIIPSSKPLPYDSKFNKSFADICDIQAQNILNKNKKINLFWSGGLDSTTALVALLSNAKEKNQITILANYNSIIESGYMYDTFFKKYNSIIDTNGGKSFYNQDELYISGALGNQLFTLGAFDFKMDIDKIHKPFVDIVDKNKIDFLYPAISKSPRPIKTFEDFIWFQTYMFKWDHQRYALINKWLNPKSIEKHVDVILGFYYNILFEQWSIHREEQQYQLSNYHLTSKLPMRKYIYSRLGKNSLDYITKKKISHSIFTLYNGNYKYTTEDYKVHYDNTL